MIRVAFGGVAALTALFLVWLWLLGDAVPGAFSTARATVRTFDLEQLHSAPEPAALARTALRLVEERLETVAPFEEPAPIAPANVGPAEEEASAVEPSVDVLDERSVEVEQGVEAALIRRMLAVYALTGTPE